MNDLALIAIPLLPLLGFFINGAIAVAESRGLKPVGRGFVALVACLSPGLAFVLSVQAFLLLRANPTLLSLSAPNLFDWMVLGDFSLSFGLSIDRLSSLMTLIVTGVGSLIHVYSIGYMREDPAFARYMACLNLFLFFMLTLVVGDSLPLLFVGWEGVGLCSYLLIGFWFSDPEKAAAGKKAFIVNRIGDFAFLIGMFVIVAALKADGPGEEGVWTAGTLDFLTLNARAASLAPYAPLIALCLFIGATGKSAQIPLYVWLPDAMAGPTPVSALIHAATMVTAGIYMVARMSFLFVMAPAVMDLVATVGLLTALLAALIAVAQNDIKKVLAYSTVSQLGFMVMALGVGGFTAAMFHVMTHAFFKACLFLGAGCVIHVMHHEQDIRNMGGLARRMPVTTATFFVSVLAIAGIPPLSGFFSKDEILYLLYASAPHRAYYWVALATAGLTAFYMMRLFALAFLGESRSPHPEKIREAPAVMTLPLVVLALLAMVGGFVGLPHIFGHNYLSDWLGSLGQTTPHHVPGPLQESHLMMISAVWATLCLAVSWFVYTRRIDLARGFTLRFGALHRLAADKFRVDEFYSAVVVRPLDFLSEKLLHGVVDRLLVDGLMVHGWADVSRFFSLGFSTMHTGFASHYVAYFILAAGFVLAFLVPG